MILYVIRHAEAVDGNSTLRDEWRYLTEKGRSAAAKVSSRMAGFGPKPRLTITSPLTRAVQTAEIAAVNACRKNVVVASELLLPGADVADLLSYLKECGSAKRVMLVGHEPQLGSLVAALLGRSEEAVTLKKGSCVVFDYEPGRDGEAADGFICYLAPGGKRITSLKKAFPHLFNSRK